VAQLRSHGLDAPGWIGSRDLLSGFRIELAQMAAAAIVPLYSTVLIVPLIKSCLGRRASGSVIPHPAELFSGEFEMHPEIPEVPSAV
jgi:hypothetical protein